MIEGADRELFERSLRHANESCTGAELDAALAELGWHEALAVDPRTAVSIHFEWQGRANRTSSAIDHVVAAALGIERPTAVVLPALGQSVPPGRLSDDGIDVDDRFNFDGVGTAGLSAAPEVLVTAATGHKAVAAVAPVGALEVRTIGGIDPELGLVRVSGRMAAVQAGPVEWSAAVELARLALAHELVGASRAMLDLARAHALERVQFGQPIAAFQAVRHRLADTLVAIEMAEAVLDGAWLERGPQQAAIAKAVAGRGARTAARNCQQVLAGIGFTTEHPFHRYVRRSLVLDELFGASRTITRTLGDEVLASGRLPPPVPL